MNSFICHLNLSSRLTYNSQKIVRLEFSCFDCFGGVFLMPQHEHVDPGHGNPPITWIFLTIKKPQLSHKILLFSWNPAKINQGKGKWEGSEVQICNSGRSDCSAHAQAQGEGRLVRYPRDRMWMRVVAQETSQGENSKWYWLENKPYPGSWQGELGRGVFASSTTAKIDCLETSCVPQPKPRKSIPGTSESTVTHCLVLLRFMGW